MPMTLRLDPEQERRLARLAKLHHVSKAAVMKQALDEKYERERHRLRVREAMAFVKSRDRGILDRLADA
jgi:predicted transcriptional regulator